MIDMRLSQMEPGDSRGIPCKNGKPVDWAILSLLPDAKGSCSVIYSIPKPLVRHFSYYELNINLDDWVV